MNFPQAWQDLENRTECALLIDEAHDLLEVECRFGTVCGSEVIIWQQLRRMYLAGFFHEQVKRERQ